MNPYLASAAVLAFLTGVVHSCLGEWRIFGRMRRAGQLVPTEGGGWARDFHVRILWASWHGVTAFGWACAAILGWQANRSPDAAVPLIIAAAMAAAAGLVLVATRGRHPGWIALLLVAVLAAVGATG